MGKVNIKLIHMKFVNHAKTAEAAAATIVLSPPLHSSCAKHRPVLQAFFLGGEVGLGFELRAS
jgi:hypothetical protein